MTMQIRSKIINKLVIVGKTIFGEKSVGIIVMSWDTVGIFAEINNQ
jgi:hypothetical protein